MNDQLEVGRTLVRSFFAVLVGIVISLFAYMSLSLLVVAFFFPADWKLLSESMAEKAAATKVAKEKGEDPPKPTKVKLSDMSYAVCPILQALCAWIGGWVTARLAPLSHAGHGILVAGFLLLTTVQLLLRNDSPQPTWLLGVNAVLGPLCVMWGASFAANGMIEPDEVTSDE